MSSHYLKIVFLEEPPKSHATCTSRVVPFANSDVYFAHIESAEKLTKKEDVKTVYNLSLNLTGIDHEFLPGDTIGVLPCNDPVFVEGLLVRLNIESLAEKPYELRILQDTTKKNATVPKHLPAQGTLKNIFLNNVDIQTPPKKLFLKVLATFCQDRADASRLETICSPRGSSNYAELITGPGRTLLGLLNTFPSCEPPVEVILEHLPPLLPRLYSISSSPLLANKLEITFFILVHDDGSKGVCTGWLERLIKRNNAADVVPFYFRQPHNFRLPPDQSVPLILIATGTGLAPFRGFLQHRLLKEVKGEVWLFYGCRYSDRDYLYKNEIHDYLKNKVLTRVDVAFSREQEEKNYVQHNIEKYGYRFTDWILQSNAKVFVCGDAKTVVKDVKIAIVSNLTKFGEMSAIDAEIYLKNMEKKDKFIVDMWG